MLSGNTKIKGRRAGAVGRPLVDLPVKGRSREEYNRYMREYMKRKRISAGLPTKLQLLDRPEDRIDCSRAERAPIAQHVEIVAVLMGDPAPSRRRF